MNKDEDWLIAVKISYIVMGNWIHDFFDRLPNTSIKNELYTLYYNDSDKSENKRVFIAFHVLNRTAEDIAGILPCNRRTVFKKLERERVSFAKWLCQKSPEAAAFKEIQKRLEADILKQIQECA